MRFMQGAKGTVHQRCKGGRYTSLKSKKLAWQLSMSLLLSPSSLSLPSASGLAQLGYDSHLCNGLRRSASRRMSQALK